MRSPDPIVGGLPATKSAESAESITVQNMAISSNDLHFRRIREEAERVGKHVLWDRRPIKWFKKGIDVYVVPYDFDLADLFLCTEEERKSYWVAWFAEVNINGV